MTWTSNSGRAAERDVGIDREEDVKRTPPQERHNHSFAEDGIAQASISCRAVKMADWRMQISSAWGTYARARQKNGTIKTVMTRKRPDTNDLHPTLAGLTDQ